MGEPVIILLGLLAALASTAGIAIFEIVRPFGEDEDLWNLCRSRLLGWAAIFGVWGGATYGVLLLTRNAAGLQLAGGKPPTWGVGGASILVAQVIGRSQIVRGQSPFAMLLRRARANVYRHILASTDNDTRLCQRVCRGLVSACPARELAVEFDRWANSEQSTAQARKLHEWSAGILQDGLLEEPEKRETLGLRFVKDALPVAKQLARDRATDIIDKGGL